ncbi:hypothetical protein JRO89_XS09G0009700 [Xanthoceras sorbifolium]|uniref:Uncharacterized protein n=1 Tax=Xanthoceras sorbifolium TaxID=99658 RepID=A0ABQ8HK32_9ROSI|nr:hypothetical protein JRO89_XS09G0009700 [Xanthoceras sorbifolium]
MISQLTQLKYGFAVNALREIKGSLIDVHNSLTGTEVTRASRSGPEFCATIQQWRIAIYMLVSEFGFIGKAAPHVIVFSFVSEFVLHLNPCFGISPTDMVHVFVFIKGFYVEQHNWEHTTADRKYEVTKTLAPKWKPVDGHMNNNLISRQIPPEPFKLPNLIHFLLDNNKLTGHLPPEFSDMKNLKILQLDNNNFGETTIPDSYSKMSNLLKLIQVSRSLRNCSLQGPIPDLSRIPNLYYVDFANNQLLNISGSFDLPLNVILRL